MSDWVRLPTSIALAMNAKMMKGIPASAPRRAPTRSLQAGAVDLRSPEGFQPPALSSRFHEVFQIAPRGFLCRRQADVVGAGRLLLARVLDERLGIGTRSSE